MLLVSIYTEEIIRDSTTDSGVKMFSTVSCVIQRRQWHPLLLPGKSHGWRSLVGCSPLGHEESSMTERLHFHFSLSCLGEGNGNPLQCSTFLYWSVVDSGFPGGTSGEEPACQCRRYKRCGFDPWVGGPFGEAMATHSSILAWRIPQTEESGGLQSMELQRVRHDCCCCC